MPDPVRFEKKSPYLVLFWADTRELLTYDEQREVESKILVVTAMTPREVLLSLEDGRRIVIQGILDPGAPEVPRPRH